VNNVQNGHTDVGYY